MDCDGDHFMNTEYCFFDGKWKRCRGFVTLSASVYHPLLRKQITLATMEAESENHTNVRLFWDILNECLRKVSGKANYKFNPVGWCTDMAGANLAGLSEVFGETVTDRIKTCEFHFKDPRNKNARKLDPDSAVEFKTRCYNLLLSATEGAYKCSIVVPAIMQRLPENFRLTITRGEEFLTWLMERMLQAFLKELELREDHFYAMTSSKPSYSNRLDGKDN